MQTCQCSPMHFAKPFRRRRPRLPPRLFRRESVPISRDLLDGRLHGGAKDGREGRLKWAGDRKNTFRKTVTRLPKTLRERWGGDRTSFIRTASNQRRLRSRRCGHHANGVAAHCMREPKASDWRTGCARSVPESPNRLMRRWKNSPQGRRPYYGSYQSQPSLYLDSLHFSDTNLRANS